MHQGQNEPISTLNGDAMKKTIFFKALVTGLVLSITSRSFTMEEEPVDPQLKIVRADYQQKWKAMQPQEATPATESSVPHTSVQLQVQQPAQNQSENIVHMFLHDPEQYEATYGALPHELQLALGEKVLQAVPEIEQCVTRFLTVNNNVTQRTWKYRTPLSPVYPQDPRVDQRSQYIGKTISLATFDASGKRIAYATASCEPGDYANISVYSTENMELIWNSGYPMKNIINIAFDENTTSLLVTNASENEYRIDLSKPMKLNSRYPDRKLSRAAFAAIISQKEEKRALLACVNADGEQPDNPLYGFKRHVDGREIRDAHFDPSGQLLYILAMAPLDHRPWVSKNLPHKEREVIIYDLRNNKLIYHYRTIGYSGIADCLCVHPFTGQLFFHEQDNYGYVKYLVNVPFTGDLQQLVRNITLDQAITLCVLFQMKRQNKLGNIDQVPHLRSYCENLPTGLLKYFFTPKQNGFKVVDVPDYTQVKSECVIL